jgi:hypothetical protein
MQSDFFTLLLNKSIAFGTYVTALAPHSTRLTFIMTPSPFHIEPVNFEALTNVDCISHKANIKPSGFFEMLFEIRYTNPCMVYSIVAQSSPLYSGVNLSDAIF